MIMKINHYKIRFKIFQRVEEGGNSIHHYLSWLGKERKAFNKQYKIKSSRDFGLKESNFDAWLMRKYPEKRHNKALENSMKINT
jgi:hypothetical protein